MTVIFDKLRFSKRLEADNSFDRRQAEALTEALHDAISEGIATKQDVSDATALLRHEIVSTKAELRHEMAVMKAELRHEIAATKAELREEIAATKAELREEIATTRADLRGDIAALRTEIRDVEVRLMRRTAATVGVALAIVGAFRFLVH